MVTGGSCRLGGTSVMLLLLFGFGGPAAALWKAVVFTLHVHRQSLPQRTEPRVAPDGHDGRGAQRHPQVLDLIPAVGDAAGHQKVHPPPERALQLALIVPRCAVPRLRRGPRRRGLGLPRSCGVGVRLGAGGGAAAALLPEALQRVRAPVREQRLEHGDHRRDGICRPVRRGRLKEAEPGGEGAITAQVRAAFGTPGCAHWCGV